MLINERAKKQRAIWEILKTSSLVEAVHKARDLGWAENKVQVKQFQLGINTDGPIMEYIIEPYEKDCGCASLMKYADFFLPPIEDDLTLI